MTAELPARVIALIEHDPLYGCWMWRADKCDRHGYGTYWTTGGARLAHRFVYETLVGPVPEGMVLDHNCRRRACCRPAHLETISGAENDRRRSWRYRTRMKACPRGHSLATAIVTVEGGRLCRTCQGPEADPPRPTLTVTPDDMRASIDDGAAFMWMPRAGDEP